MAYNVHYRVTQASLSGSNTVLDLLDESGAAIVNYQATALQLEYIPASDDPFEPIYASQLNVGIDVTDNAANMPDFTEINDRKYWAKYYKGGVLKWQGWAISDNVQYLFSSGFKELRFNCVCGLGMLDKIEFESSVTDYRATIWQHFLDCIRRLEYPTPPQIVDFISIFGGSMQNRLDDAVATPWIQSYMAINNFVQIETDTQGITRNAYSCLRVLRDILSSWGARIFMANGEWNIIQVNQMAEATRYFTRYTGNGTTISGGTVTDLKNVPTDLIFVNNEQYKIYKKGFNNFSLFKQIQFPQNMLFNANLKQLTSGNADFWAATVAGTGLVQVRQNQTKELNAFILALGNVTTGALAQVESQTPIPISVGDSPKIQFRIYNTTANTDVVGALLPNCILRIIVSGGSSSVYLADDNTWKTFTIGVSDFYRVEDKKPNTLVNLEGIPGVPIDGDLSFGILIQGSGINTQSAIIIGDFEITTNSNFKSVRISAEINATDSYRKEFDLPHGFNINVSSLSNVKPGFLGAITDSDGNQIYGWYMQERFGIDNYFSLAELMFQNYVNMFRQNIINIDGTLEGTFEAAQPVSFTDLDPAQISVTGNKYIIGNCIFDARRNECQGTFLQVDNTHQEVTPTVVYDNGIGVGIAQNMSNSGGISSGAACAFTTYPLTKYSVQFLPVVGDVIYNDVDLTQPFAGATIWYKFFIPYFNTTRAYRINTSGVITEVGFC